MKTILSVLGLMVSAAVYAAPDSPTPAPAGLRIKFQAYDGDVKTPANMEFQINPIGAGGRTEFVRIGDTIAGTKLKVEKFTFKEVKNSKTGEQNDVSELTVRDAVTGKQYALILSKEVAIDSAPK